MKPGRIVLPLLVLLTVTLTTAIQAKRATSDDDKPAKSEALEPRAKNGKKLLTALDLMKVANVGAPRIAPDGKRVVYTVSETRIDKDKEWKVVTQIWVVPIAGSTARQYTRGDKSATAPEWSPDGT